MGRPKPVLIDKQFSRSRFEFAWHKVKGLSADCRKPLNSLCIPLMVMSCLCSLVK